VAAEAPPAAIAEVHTTVAAVGSSSEADTSAGLGEHTTAAGVEGRSTLAAAGAFGIVEGPSFEAGVNISIESIASYLHLHDYLSWCLSHQFSFEEAADTSWDRPEGFMAADSAAIWHSIYATANWGRPHIELAQLAYQLVLVELAEASAYR